MTGGTLPWAIAALALTAITGLLAGAWIGYGRGWKHAVEDAEDARSAAVIDEWKGLPDEDAPAPPWPAAPPQAPRAGPGKHRNPAGPARHAGLPAAGYLPATPWDGTITLPAPAQSPPWAGPDAPAYRPDQLLRGRSDGPDVTGPLTDWEPVPEPQTQVLEPTAVLSPDSLTDTGWTRQMARDMDAWIAEHIGATDSTLKAITK